MSKSKVWIKAKHSLEMSCPECFDKCEIEVTSEYGDGLVDRVAAFTARHQACLDRIDARIDEKNRKDREASRPMAAPEIKSQVAH